MRSVVIGIDAGGSRTRVACADRDGNLLSLFCDKGVNPTHNTDGKLVLERALLAALRQAERQPEDVGALVLGCAGIDHERDLIWARDYTAISGISCPMLHVNDAHVAHAGAFGGRPGIIAVSGTGSIVWGCTPQREIVRNYDFAHYAHSAARHLAFSAVYELLTRKHQAADSMLQSAALQHFKVQSVAELHTLAQRNLQLPEQALNAGYAGFAAAVTSAALDGSPLGRTACDKAMAELSQGIGLVAPALRMQLVPVALMGSVARAPYCTMRLREFLQELETCCEIEDPVLQPVGGAVVMSLRLLGVELDQQQLRALNQSLGPACW